MTNIINNSIMDVFYQLYLRWATTDGENRKAQKNPECSILDVLQGLNVSLYDGEWKILLLKCFEWSQGFKGK